MSAAGSHPIAILDFIPVITIKYVSNLLRNFGKGWATSYICVSPIMDVA
jgi:hypothetical protein